MKGSTKHSSNAVSGKMRFAKLSSKKAAFGLTILGYSLFSGLINVALKHSQ